MPDVCPLSMRCPAPPLSLHVCERPWCSPAPPERLLADAVPHENELLPYPGLEQKKSTLPPAERLLADWTSSALESQYYEYDYWVEDAWVSGGEGCVCACVCVYVCACVCVHASVCVCVRAREHARAGGCIGM